MLMSGGEAAVSGRTAGSHIFAGEMECTCIELMSGKHTGNKGATSMRAESPPCLIFHRYHFPQQPDVSFQRTTMYK